MPDNAKNWILNARACRYFWQGCGALSLKTFKGGRAVYRMDNTRVMIEDSCYLILNNGQEYSIEIDSEAEVESFCIFFREGFAAEVLDSLATKPEILLEQPADNEQITPYFFQRTYHYDSYLLAQIQTIQDGYS